MLSAVNGLAAESIIYETLSGVTYELAAVRGAMQATIDRALTIGVDTRVVDWLIDVKALEIEPIEGDLIHAGDCVFEVCPPSTGEPVFIYSDHAQTRMRVHTKEVKR